MTRWALLLALGMGLLLPRSGAAQVEPGAEFADEVVDEDSAESAREEALFGAASPDPQDEEAADVSDPDASTPSATESLGLSEGPSALEISDRLAEADNSLAIGGMLYQRLDWTARSEGYPETFPWSTPALVDLYLDARPNDRLRAFVKGRLSHNFTARGDETDFNGDPVAPTRVFLDQLWLKWDLLRTVFVTVGQQPLRWGSGRFWNPTDFLNRSFKDPLAVFDERLGVTLLKFHLPLEALGWNLYAIADLGGARTPEDVSAAFRGEFLFQTTELALSAAVGKDEPLRLGADLTTGLGPVDLHLESALLHGVRAPVYEGDLDLASAVFPTEVDMSDAWVFRLSAGAELGINISDEDALYLGVEYFYNGLGYGDAALYPWLIAQGAFTPFYLGRHYLAGYAMLPAPGRWDDLSVTLSALSNLSDRSVVTRLDFSLQVVTSLRFNVYVSGHFGEEGEFRFGLDLPPLPMVPGLEDGLRVAPPLLDLGMGLTVAI